MSAPRPLVDAVHLVDGLGVEDRILRAWRGDLELMTNSAHELVTLAVRETARAARDEMRPYTVRELCAAFDIGVSSLGSRFCRAEVGHNSAPREIIRAARVLIGVDRLEQLRRKQYAHTLRVRAFCYDMGMGHTHAFTAFVKRADPPGFAASGQRALEWFRVQKFDPIAELYAARLFARWEGFHPVPPPAAIRRPLVVCESCNRPLYAVPR